MGGPTLPEIIASGDKLASLQAIRDALATLLVTADEKTAPALAQRLVALMAEIDAVAGNAKESVIERLRDDVAAQRVKRQAAAGS